MLTIWYTKLNINVLREYSGYSTDMLLRNNRFCKKKVHKKRSYNGFYVRNLSSLGFLDLFYSYKIVMKG